MQYEKADELLVQIVIIYCLGDTGFSDSPYKGSISYMPAGAIIISLGKYIDYLSNRIETMQIQEEREF